MRMRPTTLGWPPSISARMRGHSSEDRRDARRFAAEHRRDAGRGIGPQRLQVEVAERDAQPVQGLDLAPDQGAEPWAPVLGWLGLAGRRQRCLVQVARREGHPAAESRGRVPEPHDTRIERTQPEGGTGRERVGEGQAVDARQEARSRGRLRVGDRPGRRGVTGVERGPRVHGRHGDRGLLRALGRRRGRVRALADGHPDDRRRACPAPRADRATARARPAARGRHPGPAAPSTGPPR